jgi:hypothetical protein
MAVKRSAKSKRSWGAWAGDEDALARVIERMQDLAMDAYEADIAELNKEVEELERSREAQLKELAELKEALGENPASEIQELRQDTYHLRQERLRGQEEYWTVMMTAAEKELSLEQTSSAKTLLPSLDPRRIESIKLAVGRRLDGPLRIEVGAYKLAGCELQVEGADTRRVRLGLDELSSELSAGVPWWEWLRREGAWAAWAGLGALLGILVGFSLASETATSDTTSSVVTSTFSLGIGAGLAFFWATRRLLPGFELHAPGVSSKGRRALGIIGTWLAFLIGIIVNLVTSKS